MPISDVERMLLRGIRRQHTENLTSTNPLVQMISSNTVWLLDLIEHLEPGSTRENQNKTVEKSNDSE